VLNSRFGENRKQKKKSRVDLKVGLDAVSGVYMSPAEQGGNSVKRRNFFDYTKNKKKISIFWSIPY